MAKIKVPAGKEICGQCGGWGGEDAANFGDSGWHPCYRCGETGYVPEGTAERERLAYEEELRLNPPRPAYRDQDYYDY